MLQDYIEIEPFKEKKIVDYFKEISNQVSDQVSSATKHTLTTDTEFISSLIDKYRISVPLSIDKRDVRHEKLDDVRIVKEEYGHKYDDNLRRFFVSYGFTGDANLFSMKYATYINDQQSKFFISNIYCRIGIIVEMAILDADNFTNEVDLRFRGLFSGVAFLNGEVEKFNSKLESDVMKLVRERIERLTEEEVFLNEVNSRRR